MEDTSSLCHSSWDCKYHIVWIPKCRRKVMFGNIRNHLGEISHELARQKECRIVERKFQMKKAKKTLKSMALKLFLFSSVRLHDTSQNHFLDVPLYFGRFCYYVR
jgi:putative transposase